MPPRSTQVGYRKLAAHKSRRYDYLKSSVGKTKLEFDLLRSITLRIKNRGAEDTEKLFDVSPVASVTPRFNSYTTGWLLKRIGLSKSNLPPRRPFKILSQRFGLVPTMAFSVVVVNDPHRLHERIAGGRPHKLPPQLFQFLAHLFRLRSHCSFGIKFPRLLGFE